MYLKIVLFQFVASLLIRLKRLRMLYEIWIHKSKLECCHGQCKLTIVTFLCLEDHWQSEKVNQPYFTSITRDSNNN